MRKGVLTAPTVNGNDSVISGLSNPKAIILWTTKQTAAGAADKHGEFYLGAATFDGGAVQQWYISFADEDALGTSNTARGNNTTACLKGYSAFTTPTVEFEARLVSMDATSVTIDWFDAPATAILVHYLVVEGTDATSARCGNFTTSTAVATQNVTVNAGFGQPDLHFFATNSSTTQGEAASSTRLNLGWANKAGERRQSGIWANDAATTMNLSAVQTEHAFATLASVTAFEAQANLSAAASWPTDGFQIAYADQASVLHFVYYLAIKGVQSKIGVNTAPITGTPPVVQDNAAGFAPTGGIFMGWHKGAATTIDSTGADVIGWFFGATDGTNEGLSAYTQDDANTTSFSGNVHSETKSLANYTSPGVAGAPTLQSEADGSFSGNNVRASWNDIDTVAREYIWVALGAAAGGVRPLFELRPLLMTLSRNRG